MKVLTEKKEKIKLDKKDIRILRSLCDNYRTPLAEIARNVMLSRTSVENRVENMKNGGLIVGGRAVINLKELGYKTYHIFIEALNSKKESRLVENAIKNESVNAMVAYSGRYVLEISITARTPEEFLEIVENMFGSLNVNYGCSLMILKTLKSSILPEYFFKGLEHKNENFKVFRKIEKCKIDKKDLEIINIVADDSGISLVDLASKLKMNKDTAAYRLKQLVNNKYILQFRPAINYSVLGLTIHTLLLRTKSATNDEMKKFDDYLRNKDDVLWAAKTFGEWQYIIYLVLNENDELHNFIQGLMSGFEELIDGYELLFAYKEYKYSFFSKNIRIE